MKGNSSDSTSTYASQRHSVKQIVYFPREGEALIAPGEALAEPGVTYKTNCAPEGSQDGFKSSNQKQIADQMKYDSRS